MFMTTAQTIACGNSSVTSDAHHTLIYDDIDDITDKFCVLYIAHYIITTRSNAYITP